MKRIGLAILSRAHLYSQITIDQACKNPNAEVVAVWDEDPIRGKQEAERLNVPFYEDLVDILALDTVQAVVNNSPTYLHPQVLIYSAKAGKHIFTEKPLAITVEDADMIKEAVEKAGVKFMISLPSRTLPEILFARQALDQGLLGEITAIHARVAYQAALEKWFLRDGITWFGDEKMAGGGAFFDLGCHGVDMLRWFLGEPARVVALKNNYSKTYEVEDHMSAIIEFRKKAIGVIEASWLEEYGQTPFEIYGTKGALTLSSPSAEVYIHTKFFKGNIEHNNLPVASPSPVDQWLESILYDKDTSTILQDAWNLTQLLEACYTAARTGIEVRL